MLEFNEKHKFADLSSIKTKLNNAKHTGKVLLCGVLISATMVLSGCGTSEVFGTAILFENENALIVDVVSSSTSFNGNNVNYLVLKTKDGESIYAAAENVQIIKGENSREIAEAVAESLVSENGKISYYEDIIENTKSR